MRAGETGTQQFWFYFRRSFLDGHRDERHDRAEAIEDLVLSLPPARRRPSRYAVVSSGLHYHTLDQHKPWAPDPNIPMAQ